MIRPMLRVGALGVAAVLPGAAAGAAAAAPQAPDSPVQVTHKRLNVAAGHRVAVDGVVPAATPGTAVSLQVRDGGRWRTLDRARTRANGSYALRDRPHASMSARARVRIPGATASLGRLNVYRRARASWYGPGLYGNRTGCGGTLSAGRLGVAHKGLPCGTRVTLRHGGHVLRVPVIDRGPYVGGREFDLTRATAEALGFHGHGTLQVAE